MIKEVVKPQIQYVDRVVEKEIIKEVVKEIEVPVEVVRVETVERVVEKIVEKDRFVKVDENCECISEAGFVAMWNKIMHIKFDKLRDECLSENRMLDIILSGMKRRDIVHKEILMERDVKSENIVEFEKKTIVEPIAKPPPVIREVRPRQTVVE